MAAPRVVEPAGAASAAEHALAALRAQVGQELERVHARRAARGILPADLDGYQDLSATVQRALAAGDADGARLALAQLDELVESTRIDERFINRKLARLSALSRERPADDPNARERAALLSKVHEAFFAGDYERANEHLNQMSRLLR